MGCRGSRDYWGEVGGNQGSTNNGYVCIQIFGALRVRATYAHHIYLLVGPNVYF